MWREEQNIPSKSQMALALNVLLVGVMIETLLYVDISSWQNPEEKPGPVLL